MEHLSQYGHAIASVALYGVIAQVLNAATGIRKGALNMAPGENYAPNYDDPAYRLDRTYMNTIESLVFFAAIVAAAILAGASPFWINLLASLALVTRVAMLVVHLRGIGKPHNGPRSVFYVSGWVCMLVIALFALVAVVS